MSSKSKSTLFDILTGSLVAILTYTILSILPFNISLVIAAPLPVIAGFIRGKNSERIVLVKVVLMNILFFPLVAAIMNGVFHLLLILFFGLIGAALGILFRRNFSTSKIKTATLTFLFFTSVVSIGFFFVPSYFDKLLWSDKAIASLGYLFLSPQGDTIRSTDHLNKVVVIDFWATWCGPCKKQLPLMEDVYQLYRGNQNVVFLFVNPCGRDTHKKALEFIQKNSYDLPFAMDIKYASTRRFHITGLPTIVIIDKKGVVRLIHRGYEESENFVAMFRSQLDLLISKD